MKKPLEQRRIEISWFSGFLALVSVLALTLFLAPSSRSQKAVIRHYRLFDIGTLGGPNSQPPSNSFTGLPTPSISNGGIFAGDAELDLPDPYAPACVNPDCIVSHAISWKDGVMTDLGTLPGPAGSTSVVSWVGPTGLIVGFSENGTFDPGANGPAVIGALWNGTRIAPLSPLRGGLESAAYAVNSSGIVVGISSNDVPDPNSLFGTSTQTRAVVWLNGEPHDLGTLGGTDAQAFYVNESGQIAGQSYTADSIPPPNLHCSDDPLTLHAFFWEYGKMTDLNTFGGHCTFVYGMNNLGQLVGQSTTVDDATSLPFLWQNSHLAPLPTVGGTYGYAVSISDVGEIAGITSALGDQALLATSWTGGHAKNLGTLPGNSCSLTDAINIRGQIVGGSGFDDAAFFPACTDLVEHAVLWQNGQILDLNTFVPPGSDLTLNEAVFINDSGEIAGFGTLPNGNRHAFLLVPCQEYEDGCELANPNFDPKTKHSSPASLGTANRLRGRFSRPYRRFGAVQPPTN